MIMKKIIISLVVLAAVAGTVLAVTTRRTKTFAQENLEALTAGELTEEQIRVACFMHCKYNWDAFCVLDNDPFPDIVLTCAEYENWPDF